jgi:hypothetical protein
MKILIFSGLMPECAMMTRRRCNKTTGAYIKVREDCDLQRTTKFAWVQAEQ